MSNERYNIVVAQPEGFAHTRVLADVARLLHASLRSLGHHSQISINTYRSDAINILLGYHTLKRQAELREIPFIIYQLEQLTDKDDRFRQDWLDVLGTARMVWDYSPLNIRFLNERGIRNVHHLPLGYHPSLTTIPPHQQDVDVLHYGSMNARRRRVMIALQPRCRLLHLFGVYGPERDAAIARSKIIINLHMNGEPRFEQVRVSYLLNNGRFVITEPAEDSPYEEMVVSAPYDQIAETCLKYLHSEDLRQHVAREGFSRFQSMRMEELLRPALL